jgi:calcium-dependent protein kinase
MMKGGMDWTNTSRQYSRAVYNTLSRKMFKDISLKLDHNSGPLGAAAKEQQSGSHFSAAEKEHQRDLG